MVQVRSQMLQKCWEAMWWPLLQGHRVRQEIRGDACIPHFMLEKFKQACASEAVKVVRYWGIVLGKQEKFRKK